MTVDIYFSIVMTPQYKLNNGSYILFDADAEPNCHTKERDVILTTDQVAICFDKETGTVHLHGKSDLVEKWAENARKQFRDSGFSQMADNIIVVSGDLPLEEINKCLSNSGYAKIMYRKLDSLLPADKSDPIIAEPEADSPRP